MIRLFAVICLSILALTGVQPTLASNDIPPGSFIRAEANNVGQLVKQVQNDPVVRKRYASHFGVSPDYLVDYINTEVELVTLREPLKTRVWYVGKDGKIFSKTKLLPRGSQVFATRDGKPLILWRCGNPLLSALPAKRPVPAPPVTEVKSAEPEEISAPPVFTPPAAMMNPILGTVESSPAGVAAGPVAALPVVVAAAGGGGLPLLPIAAGGGGLFLILDDDGNPVDTPVLSPPAIPEYPTAVLALVGLLPAALLAVRRRYEA